MDIFEIKCPKCNKLLAKMNKNGNCEDILLYCRRCKKEYRYTIKANKIVK